MKNRIIFSTLAAGLLLFSACESDRESNPTLEVPDSFVLNTPALSESVYNLNESEYVELSCTQPEYGYTAPVIYTVEASFDEDFSTVETLVTSYTTAKMQVVASELAVAVTNLAVADGKNDADFPMITSAYVRLKADLANVDVTVYSNPVALDFYLDYSLEPVAFPENMYMIGSICEWSWDTAIPMVPVYASSDGELGGKFWRMQYFDADAQIKFNTATSWNGGEFGFGGATIDDVAGAGVSDEGGNIKIATAGWYVVMVQAVVKGTALTYTVSLFAPEVYLYGDTNGGVWEADAANLFTVPADGTGDFVSQPFVGDGEVRACVVLPETDWWKSEFIVLNNVLQYRGNGPDQARATGTAGQQIYINFTAGTGKIE